VDGKATKTGGLSWSGCWLGGLSNWCADEKRQGAAALQDADVLAMAAGIGGWF